MPFSHAEIRKVLKSMKFSVRSLWFELPLKAVFLSPQTLGLRYLANKLNQSLHFGFLK